VRATGIINRLAFRRVFTSFPLRSFAGCCDRADWDKSVSHLFRLISCSFEEVSAFVDREQADDVAEGLCNGIEATCGSLSQERLEFGERHLDCVQVRRIGWQKQKPSSLRLDQLLGPLALWKPTLSRMTTSPGDSLGTSCVSIHVSKMRLFIGALTIHGAIRLASKANRAMK
jgi:hypothetical protein